MQALWCHASRCINLPLPKQGMPSMWTHHLQHSTHAEELQKHQASAEPMDATGCPSSWRRTHEAKRFGICAVDLRPRQHSHDTGPTSNGQFRVGCNTNGNTIGYVKETVTVWIRWNGDVSCEGPHGGTTRRNAVPQMPPLVVASALYSRIVQHCCEACIVVYRRVMHALLGLQGAFDCLTKC